MSGIWTCTNFCEKCISAYLTHDSVKRGNVLIVVEPIWWWLLSHPNEGRGEIQGWMEISSWSWLKHNFKKSYYKSVKCLQIILRHSKIASAYLAQVIVDLENDLSFSETYPVIPNVRNPQMYSTFHALSNDDAYGSAIIIRGSIEAKSNLKKAPGQSCGVHWLENQWWSRPVFKSSATAIFASVGSTNIVYGVDSSARNPVWNSTTTVVICAELEMILHTKNLYLLLTCPRNILILYPPGRHFRISISSLIV